MSVCVSVALSPVSAPSLVSERLWPGAQPVAVSSTPNTEQRRVRRGNFLLERTVSSAEKFMCHAVSGAAVVRSPLSSAPEHHSVLQ